MTKGLLVNPDLCSGCRYCEVACSFRRTGQAGYGASLIVVSRDDRLCEYTPLVCQNCANAPCIDVCPTGAAGRNGVEGRVSIDSGLCAGCELCAEVCPFSLAGVLRMPRIADGVAAICDYCGGNPACARFCVTGALKYVELEQPTTNQMIR